MAHLAPPPQVTITAGTAAGPRPHAVQLGGLQCASCHRDDATSSCRRRRAACLGHPLPPVLRLPRHDMGTLGDGIGNAGDSVAVTRRMRTAPLWGLRSRNKQAARRPHDRHRDGHLAHNGGANGQGTAGRGGVQRPLDRPEERSRRVPEYSLAEHPPIPTPDGAVPHGAAPFFFRSRRLFRHLQTRFPHYTNDISSSIRIYDSKGPLGGGFPTRVLDRFLVGDRVVDFVPDLGRRRRPLFKPMGPPALRAFIKSCRLGPDVRKRRRQ